MQRIKWEEKRKRGNVSRRETLTTESSIPWAAGRSRWTKSRHTVFVQFSWRVPIERSVIAHEGLHAIPKSDGHCTFGHRHVCASGCRLLGSARVNCTTATDLANCRRRERNVRQVTPRCEIHQSEIERL